jgi:pyruvate/2-oxoglutarate dehydrogenase complex dihydrolipoamide acyltransferase (E2) component
VAFAVAVPGSDERLFSGALITPIVDGVERRGVRDIAAKARELIARAKQGKLKPHEYQGGSFWYVYYVCGCSEMFAMSLTRY